QIEEMRRKAELAKANAEAETTRIRAQSEAQATEVRARAERARLQAQSQNLSPNYVRVQALEALAKALSGSNAKLVVLPVGKDGLPAFFSPFLNPYSNVFGSVAAEK